MSEGGYALKPMLVVACFVHLHIHTCSVQVIMGSNLSPDDQSSLSELTRA